MENINTLQESDLMGNVFIYLKHRQMVSIFVTKRMSSSTSILMYPLEHVFTVYWDKSCFTVS